MARDNPNHCILDGCAVRKKSFGLCPMHYVSTAKRVKAGETTWEEEVAAGRALPKTSKLRRDMNLSIEELRCDY